MARKVVAGGSIDSSCSDPVTLARPRPEHEAPGSFGRLGPRAQPVDLKLIGRRLGGSGLPGWRRPRRWVRWPVVSALVVASLALAGSLQLTRAVPYPTTHLTFAASGKVSGSAPQLSWPPQGQAAVGVPALGLVLSSGPQQPVPIASVAKIMTAFVVLRDHPIDPGGAGPEVVVSASEQLQSAAEESANDTTLPVQAGEMLSERQLLDGMLVHSANDFAEILARWDAGSISAFVTKMNSEAVVLRMHGTRYADPAGIDVRTVSTASDQVRLSAAAMQVPTFATVVAQPSTDLPFAGVVANYVRAIGTDGIVGIKSGFTQAAMGCVVLAGDREVDGVQTLVLGAVTGMPGFDPLDAASQATVSLIDQTAVNLRVKRIVSAGQRVVELTEPWRSGSVSGVATSSADAVVWPGERIRGSVTLKRVHGLEPKGTTLGSIYVTVGRERFRVPVKSTGSISAPSLLWRLWNF